MKKLLSSFLIIMMCFLLSGCYKGETVNILLFTDNLNSIKEREKISLSDYIYEKGCYRLLLNEEATILLTAEEDDRKRIKKVRLTLSKADNSGNMKAVTDGEAEDFINEAIQILEAFTMQDSGICKSLIEGFLPKKSDDYLKEGELVTQKDNFHLVYYSNKLCCQFFVVNNFLEETESTSKPDGINP